DVGAGLGAGQRAGPPEPARRAGHQDALARQIEPRKFLRHCPSPIVRQALIPARTGMSACKCSAHCYRMPWSISGTSMSTFLGESVPAAVLVVKPPILYLTDSTHCSTGRKPCR